jgi:hypothetical protein
MTDLNFSTADSSSIAVISSYITIVVGAIILIALVSIGRATYKLLRDFSKEAALEYNQRFGKLTEGLSIERD